jgi:hypothetical protein
MACESYRFFDCTEIYYQKQGNNSRFRLTISFGTSLRAMSYVLLCGLGPISLQIRSLMHDDQK